MKKPKPTPRQPRTPRIKAEQHKDDLQVLAAASPAKLVRAVVSGAGYRKAEKVS